MHQLQSHLGGQKDHHLLPMIKKMTGQREPKLRAMVNTSRVETIPPGRAMTKEENVDPGGMTDEMIARMIGPIADLMKRKRTKGLGQPQRSEKFSMYVLLIINLFVHSRNIKKEPRHNDEPRMPKLHEQKAPVNNFFTF